MARAEAEAEADRAMRAMNFGDYHWYASHLAMQYAARTAAATAGTAWEAAASAVENTVLLGSTRSTSALEAGWWGLDDPHARAEREAAVAAAREAVCGLLRDTFGDPPGNDTHGSLPTPPDGGLVADLARTMYHERSFDRMPALGDALEESGCVDIAVLSHCRDRDGHVRGCWVIDALLGKS